MGIHVECYAGYRGEQEPRSFRLGERRIVVVEIVDRWTGPDYRYFRVRADDGHVYVLRHDEGRDEWTLGAFTHAQTAAPTSGIATGLHAPRRGGPE